MGDPRQEAADRETLRLAQERARQAIAAGAIERNAQVVQQAMAAPPPPSQEFRAVDPSSPTTRARMQVAQAEQDANRARQVVAPAQETVGLGAPPTAPTPPAAPAVPVDPRSPEEQAAGVAFGNAATLLGRQGTYTGPPTTNVLTQRQGGPVDEATQQALGQSTEELEQSFRDKAAVQEGALRGQEGTLQQASQGSVDEAARQVQAAQQQAQEMQRRTQQAEAINQRVLDGAINPNRVLGDSMSGGRIAAALGLFIAGLAQGQGGADAFLANINQTIDRDIAAQQANQANTLAAGNAQQNLVGMYRDTLGNEEAGIHAARATMLQSIAQRLEAQQARLGADMQDPALAGTIAQIHLLHAEASAAAQQASQSSVTTRTVRSGGMSPGRDIRGANAYRQLGDSVVAAGNTRVDNATAAQTAAAASPQAVAQQEWATIAATTPGFVPTPQAAQARPLRGPAMDQALIFGNNARALDNLFAEALQQREILTSLDVNIREKNMARQNLTRLRRDAAQLLSTIRAAGALGDVEADRYADQTGISNAPEIIDSLASNSDAGMQAVQNARRRTAQEIVIRYRGVGLQPAGAQLPTPRW